MATKKNTETEPIILPDIKLETVEIPIIGDTTLLTNAWTKQKMDDIENAALKKPHKAKEARQPQVEYENSKYVLPDGRLGLPAGAFKKAAVEACRLVDGMPMTEARLLFHVLGDLVPIEGEATFRRDMVPGNGGRGWVPVYRAEFVTWKCNLLVRYFATKLSLEQVVNLFQLAGLCGVGVWRPSSPIGKSGNHGMFHVATN